MWQRLFCPACGYSLSAADRFCGNCGVNLAMAATQIACTQKIIHRKVEAYHKLYPPRGDSPVFQNHNSSAINEINTTGTPIRSEIIKLLSSLINN